MHWCLRSVASSNNSDDTVGMGDVVIVGSGVAGHRAALEIKRLVPDRHVEVVGREAGLPYDRPPLSKEFLLSNDAARPTLGPAEAYGSGIVLHDGLVAVGLDRGDRSVTLSDGSRLGYDLLLLATGSRLRPLPLPHVDAARIHYLRTLEDAQRLSAALAGHSSVCIVGGGFIGLEVAAAARMRGCTVTVLEVAPVLLSRGGTAVLGQYLQHLHKARGVECILNAQIGDVTDTPDGVLLCWTGGEVRADVVVIGVGVLPNVELAAEAGLEVADGIVVDNACRTSDPAIFAAGEVTNYPIEKLGVRVRTESWSAASSQAMVAARTMLGLDATFDELPWFWSDQYDVNIQCMGLPKAAQRYLQIGDPTSGRWLLIGVDPSGRLVGAEGVNMGREVSALRRADRTGQPIPPWLIDLAAGREEPPVERVEPPSIAGSRS